MRLKRFFRYSVYILLFLILGGWAVLSTHSVDVKPTSQDIKVTQDIGFAHAINKPPSHFDEQLRIIRSVQERILSIAPQNKGIPFDVAREPKNLLEHRYGLCYDRSRAIEKVLKVLGFETRHVSVYKKEPNELWFEPLLQPGRSSHALSEVKTEKGWLLIDSNVPWIGLTYDNNVVSAQDLDKGQVKYSWNADISARMNSILQNDFTVVYGLYSRHGRFYPPYNVIPDVNWREILYNF